MNAPIDAKGENPKGGEDLERGFDVFISYHHDSSQRAARALERDLLSVARRNGLDGFSVFRDERSLSSGPLQRQVFDALRRSRNLVVVLHPEMRIDWVGAEIAHWLSTTGHADRLFLARAELGVDLRWDADSNDFARPDPLPTPLRGLFTEEQLFTDLFGRGIERHYAVASLCAALVGGKAEDFLAAEARAEQRRRLRLVALTVLLGLLAVVAVVAAFVAIRSRDEAERSRAAAERSEQQALAQADAAEALLTAADRPTRAIGLAVAAGRRNNSSTVRSSMLAVSNQTRRLHKALSYSEEDAGGAPEGVSFNRDGTRFVAWTTPAEGTSSFVQTWDVRDGDVLGRGVVDVGALEQVVFAGPAVLVACSAEGPVVIRFTDGVPEAEVLQDEWAPQSEDAVTCATAGFTGGAVVSGLGGDDFAGTTYRVGPRGEVEPLPGVERFTGLPTQDRVAAVGQAGLAVIPADGEVEWVSETPWPEVTLADGDGRFLIEAGDSPAFIAVPTNDGYEQRPTPPLPADTVDHAPVLRYGELTGELAWVSADGVVGWSGSDATIAVTDTEGEPVWDAHATTIEAMNDRLLVVVGSTARVLDVPDEYSAAWTAGAPLGIGAAAYEGEDPVVGWCPTRSESVVQGGPDQRHILGESGDLLPVDGEVQWSDNCQPVAIGASIERLTGPDGPTEIRSGLLASEVLLSPAGDIVALVRPGNPIELLYTLDDDQLPKPWSTVSPYTRGFVRSFGERELIDQGGLVFVGPGDQVQRDVHPEGAGSSLTVSPDGRAVVFDAIGGEGPRSILSEGVMRELDGACTTSAVTFRPGPAFETSPSGAGAQIPSTITEGAAESCLAGEAVDPSVEVLGYDIAADRGRIVFRNDGEVQLALWNPGSDSPVERRAAPPAGDRTRLAFDTKTTTALVWEESSDATLDLYAWSGSEWRPAGAFVTGVADLAGAALTADGSLVVVASTTGGFELYDAKSGRLLAQDAAPRRASSDTPIGAIALQERAEHLFLHLLPEPGALPLSVIRIPTGVGPLSSTLCDRYEADAC